MEVSQEQVTHQDPAERTTWAATLTDDVIQGLKKQQQKKTKDVAMIHFYAAA